MIGLVIKNDVIEFCSLPSGAVALLGNEHTINDVIIVLSLDLTAKIQRVNDTVRYNKILLGEQKFQNSEENIAIKIARGHFNAYWISRTLFLAQ